MQIALLSSSCSLQITKWKVSTTMAEMPDAKNLWLDYFFAHGGIMRLKLQGMEDVMIARWDWTMMARSSDQRSLASDIV